MKEFDSCSEKYFKFRPSYPKELFEWISFITPNHEVALDCGTGNGQAANRLVDFFQQIIAIDSSPNQLKESIQHPRIQYYCMCAEKTDLPDHSIDLVTSASAAHWFDLQKFYSECNRLLRSDGRIVIWTYTWPECDNIIINTLLNGIKDSLFPYWTEGSLFHLNKYKNLPFPFKQLESPNFQFEIDWNLDQTLSFFSTWACIQKYISTVNRDFINKARGKLNHYWSEGESIRFKFPLYLKAGMLDN